VVVVVEGWQVKPPLRSQCSMLREWRKVRPVASSRAVTMILEGHGGAFWVGAVLNHP